ncbi:MAG: nucleotidyltransferase, partial [Clostridiales bacterium]|nr:nucleotidyltransferase [Clostridiales bacterium]
DTPLGTGGGLSLLRGRVNDTFIFTNCDILITDDFSDIYDYHRKMHNKVTMICSLKNFKIPYGVVELGTDGCIESMREKPSISFFTNTGCYIVEPEVIDMIKDDESIGFPDVVQKLKDGGEKVGVYPISENSWLDMGQLDELDKMKTKLNLE